MSRFVQDENVVYLLAPQDTAATGLPTPFLALKTIVDGTLYVAFGNIAAASADQAVTVTLEAATVGASGSEAAVAFDYRLSSAVGTNTWGAKASATTSGVSIGTTDDGKILAINIDPAAIQAAKADATHIRAVITPDAGASATLVTAWASFTPSYKQNSMVQAC